MKKQVSPVVAVVLIGIVVLAVAAAIWRGTQNSFRMPDKPPSGPIVLPPSQQGRVMPNSPVSGAMPSGTSSRQ